MRTKYAITIVPLALLSLCAFTYMDDIIARLGLKHANAQSYIVANFTGSFSADFDVQGTKLFSPRIKDISNVIGGDKAAAARDLCQYVKEYVNSEEFQAEYQRKRAASKPTSEPVPMDQEVLESYRVSIRDMEAQLTELKKSPKENAQTIKIYEPMLAEQKAGLAEYEDPTPNKTKWDKNYPSDPAVLIRSKLQQYLDLAATVDFNAKLTEPDKYKIRKFVNSEYEQKPDYWKACYRAGKEANDAATLFVKDWMKGKIISGPKTRAVSDAAAISTATVAPAASNTPGVQDATSAGNQPEGSNTEAPQEKTSLLGKLGKKAKSLIKD